MTAVDTAHKLFDAIQNSDMDVYEKTCAPDAVMWQAHRPNQEKPFIETFQGLARLHKVVSGLAYAHRRYELLGNGDALLRHALSGTTNLGKQFAAYQMIRLTLKNGKIMRLDVYVDTAQLQPVYEATQASAAN